MARACSVAAAGKRPTRRAFWTAPNCMSMWHCRELVARPVASQFSYQFITGPWPTRPA